MTEMSSVLVCAQCGFYWSEEFEQAKCTRASHDHLRFDVHQHRSVVVLPDGTEVTAVSFDAREPYARESPPDYGLYLDTRWAPPWVHDHLEWPDFGVPDDASRVALALTTLLDRARDQNRAELGCLGGHGRTGTALACLAILCGHDPVEAIPWVRANYCAEAIETLEQEAFVVNFVDRHMM
jgi:rhodanese/phosphatase family protein